VSRVRFVFSGSGGQGVITAAVILAEAAALHQGLYAVQSQAYGPEARGGATRGDVIISDQKINFPKVTQPNVLVSLTQEAYNKYVGIVRPGGLVLTDSRYVTTERKVDARQVELPMYQQTVERLGNPVVFNICMLGVVVSLTRAVEPEAVLQSVQAHVPAKFRELNLEAFALGQEISQSAATSSALAFAVAS